MGSSKFLSTVILHLIHLKYCWINKPMYLRVDQHSAMGRENLVQQLWLNPHTAGVVLKHG